MSKLEWDDAKNAINQKKHGISFEIAARIFLHPYMEIWDEAHSGVNRMGRPLYDAGLGRGRAVCVLYRA